MSTGTVHTFCRYCLACCGIEVTVEDNRVTKISADKQNPHTWRDFCAKGRTANQLVEHPRRILNPMRRVGRHLRRSHLGRGHRRHRRPNERGDRRRRTRCRRRLLRQPGGLLVVQHHLLQRLAGRDRHTQPLLRRLGRPERDARRRFRDVRLDADGAGVRHRQLRLLPARRHQSRCQRMELAGDRARRMEAGARAQAAGREDRRRRPAADRNRRQGRRAPGGAAGTGLGAVVGDGQGRARRGPGAQRGLRRPRHRRRGTASARRRRRSRRSRVSLRRSSCRYRAGGKGFRHRLAGRWSSPGPVFRCISPGPSPSGSGTCST